MTKVQGKRISDADMYLLSEKGMKGEFPQFKRYSKASNKYLKSCDPKKESEHIKYLDRNNFCGYAMDKFLSIAGYKWIEPKEFDSIKYTSDCSKCCVLAVNLQYPKEQYEWHNHCPLAPDRLEIKKEMLSTYELKIAEFHDVPIGAVKNLMLNISEKENDLLHYENLQLY